ncbi:MAG: hypothetical protein AAGL98_07940 [Planctomycetota bacterium]
MFQSLTKTLSACVLAGACVLLVGGCSSKYSSDLTPELTSYARSDAQYRNNQAKTVEHNGRQFWDDLSRVLLLEEPSQLSRYPVP